MAETSENQGAADYWRDPPAGSERQSLSDGPPNSVVVFVVDENNARPNGENASGLPSREAAVSAD
jgi:hypothetical protein